ncbi:MAG: TIGR02300 family protein [Oricola sp.]
MAKPELGTKRICPETGRKFYDLNKDPIVSPYTGKTYPLSYFEDTKSEIIAEKAEEADEAVELDEEEEPVSADVVSLEDVEEDETSKDEALPDLGDNTDDELEIDDDDDDTFLADEEDDEDDDMIGIIDVAGGDDDET